MLSDSSPQLCEDGRGRAGTERRRTGGELRGRGARPERVASVPEIDRETAHGADDHVSRGVLGCALERTLYQRLRGEQGITRRIDERRNGRPRGGGGALRARDALLGGRPARGRDLPPPG